MILSVIRKGSSKASAIHEMSIGEPESKAVGNDCALSEGCRLTKFLLPIRFMHRSRDLRQCKGDMYLMTSHVNKPDASQN